MHDIDRTQMEYNPEMETFESEQFEYGETEWSPETGGVFSEADEIALAAELLEVQDEAELDRFLGNFIKKAASTVGRVVRSPIGQAIGGVLKGAAKQALPMVGSAVGGYFGGPTGATLGSQAATAAGRIFGLELEGLSMEDQELEVAKSFVRFAGDTVKNAASAPPSADPRSVAKAAAVYAARQHAPGLLTGAAPPTATSPLPTGGRGHSGRWMRRGTKIVLFGV